MLHPIYPKISRSRPRIGVFVEWLADGYSDPILDELVGAALECECDVVCYVGGLNGESQPAAKRRGPLHFASRETIDAVLVVSLGNQCTASQIARAMQHLEPLPMVSIAVQWSEYPSVEVSPEAGVRHAVRHLIRAHGRQRIACIRGPLTSSEADRRYHAFREALSEQAVEFHPELVTVGDYTRALGVEAIRGFLDVKRLSFDAVIAANDAMALGALEELERRGLVVPEQVAVIGFDDIEEARHCRPTLTTVRQPVRAHARAAFQVLLCQLRGEAVPAKSYVQAELVVRRSCGCAMSSGARDSVRPSSNPPRGDGSSEATAYVLKPVSDFFDNPELSARDSELGQAFLVAVTRGERAAMLSIVERELERAAVQRDLLTFAVPLKRLRERATTRPLPDMSVKHLEDLVFDLSMLVAEVATGTQATVRYRSEDRFADLVRTNETLLTAVDLASLESALLQNLERFRLPSLFVSLYQDAGDPLEPVRLTVECQAGKRPASEREVFPAAEVLPARCWPVGRPFCLLVCPLLRSQDESPGYVVFERGVPEGFVYDGLLDEIGSTFNRIRLLEQLVQQARLREIAERERLESEMRIASNIQTGILPRVTEVDGLELAASMRPASEVGGDYYDVLPFEGGCWIGIGDVAGHGLPTGLVMLMLQSVVSGLVRVNPRALPRDIVVSANGVLVDNIRHRMRQDEHITLALIRYESSGRFCFAGAHEEILICRAADGSVERLETSGLWVGIIDDISQVTDSFEGELRDGDLALLYTDGVTEAQNAEGVMFGVSRLASALSRHRALSVDAIRDAILEEVAAFMAFQRDDMTLLVARQRGGALERAQ